MMSMSTRLIEEISKQYNYVLLKQIDTFIIYTLQKEFKIHVFNIYKIKQIINNKTHHRHHKLRRNINIYKKKGQGNKNEHSTFKTSSQTESQSARKNL